jgi:hypothetical protein
MRRQRKKTDVDHGLQMPSAKLKLTTSLKFTLHNAKLTTSKKIQADHLFKKLELTTVLKKSS